MTITDKIVGVERIDEGVGEGRFKLELGQGATVETQGGSHANDWAKNRYDTGTLPGVEYDIRLNSVQRAVVVTEHVSDGAAA